MQAVANNVIGLDDFGHYGDHDLTEPTVQEHLKTSRRDHWMLVIVCLLGALVAGGIGWGVQMQLQQGTTVIHNQATIMSDLSAVKSVIASIPFKYQTKAEAQEALGEVEDQIHLINMEVERIKATMANGHYRQQIPVQPFPHGPAQRPVP